MPGTIHSKKSVAVPVRVTTEHAARPVHPPVELPTPFAHQPPAAPAKTMKAAFKAKVATAPQPMTEEQRRKIMWISVALLMALVITAWAVTFRIAPPSAGQKNIFADLKKAFADFSMGDEASNNESSQEIRNLTNQVFPQFKTTNNE